MKTTKTIPLIGLTIAILLFNSSATFGQNKNLHVDLNNWTDYQPKILIFDLNLNNDKEELSNILKWCWILFDDRPVSFKNVDFNKEQINITLNKKESTVIRYDDLNNGLVVTRQQLIIKNNEVRVFYYIHLEDNFSFKFDNSKLGNAQKLCDILFTLQHNVNLKNTKSQLDAFKPLAMQFSNSDSKPSVSEEQRKFIVQANLFSEQKEYNKAIAMYKKVIDVNSTAYPAAYFNLALLYAQVSLFDMAILNMNKYLLLVPDASDARASQDKIYEWETRFAN